MVESDQACRVSYPVFHPTAQCIRPSYVPMPGMPPIRHSVFSIRCNKVFCQEFRKLLTHATKLREVLLLSLVLLVLINPLVEVGLEEVHLFRLLEQARPVLLGQLLLAQLHLNVASRVVDLARGRVDLGVELELDMVGLLEGVGVTGECETGGLHVQLDIGRWHIGDVDGEVDKVLLGVGVGGALRPEDCRWRDMVSLVNF